MDRIHLNGESRREDFHRFRVRLCSGYEIDYFCMLPRKYPSGYRTGGSIHAQVYNVQRERDGNSLYAPVGQQALVFTSRDRNQVWDRWQELLTASAETLTSDYQPVIMEHML